MRSTKVDILTSMNDNNHSNPSHTFIMGTYRQIIYQVVFSTKYREPVIDETHETELYKYIWGIVNNHKCRLYRVNGMPDHIHIVSDLHPTVCLSDYVKNIKVSSSLWMKESGKFPMFSAWQEGYGAFTYSVKERDRLIRYVKSQKEHHRKESFYDEFRRLLIECGIDFNERYLT
ncbi:MAG: IS200/IS605 family transposase [Chryseolinea sp.]